jgi:hypothetical protein
MEAPAPEKNTAPRTLWIYFREGLAAAHRRRPVSFYMLLSVPVVLVLGARLFEYRQQPQRFLAVLTLLLLFFLVISAQAVRDFFAITRRHLRERHAAYLETLGDRKFIDTLGRRVKEGECDEPPE